MDYDRSILRFRFKQRAPRYPSFQYATLKTPTRFKGESMNTLSPTEAYATYEDLIQTLDTDLQGQRAAWDYMKQSTAQNGGHPAQISFMPRFLSSDDHTALATIAEKTHRILEKIIAGYLDDAKVRAIFSLDPRVEELIRMPQQCPTLLPYGRFDMFYDENTHQGQFVEFNADCSSGMNKTREALNAIQGSKPWQAFTNELAFTTDIKRLFNGWVEDFLGLYSQTPDAKSQPDHVAIVVCLDNDDVPFGELETYAHVFEEKGIACSIVDAQKLVFENSVLTCSNPYYGPADKPIDALWRFCIVIDLLNHWDSCQGFLDSQRTQSVPMIGSFASQAIHDKQLFAHIRKPEIQNLLSEDERAFLDETIPFTAFLNDPTLDLEEIKNNPAEWVLKPTDWYDGIGVYVGADQDSDTWKNLVDQCQETEGAYLVQAFCTPEYIPAYPIYGRSEEYSIEPQRYGILTGAYVFNGSFAGVYNRLGPNAMVTDDATMIVTPTVWID